MTKKSGNEKNLHRQIQGSQDEIKQLSVLNEFVDQVIDIDDCVVPNRLEQTWALSEQIYNAFQNPDPNSHSLFDYITKNTTKGFFNMETSALKQRKKKRKNTQNENDTQSEDNAQNDNNTQDEDE
ncbi:7064_t:CDS:2 [Dentiscutata heterogama]|uniref:7064_t:CDS:1 n=1 Tax=Dentiscutata heterogama TaxID=1316150 RepID=A0ACA9Q7E9_9GLOM|nr:7064_t:CDS:2 [Dentiscutata heterogama]